jgi:hypothetical protein
MKPDDPRDELILRHLDGETTADEQAQVTRLLAHDDGFRSRFFAFVYQITRLREILDTRMSGETPTGVRNGSTPVMVEITTRPQARPRSIEPAESLQAKIDYRQIYFNAVLGGAGGLLGWFAVALLGSLLDLESLNVYLRNALILGPFLGVCIGFAIGSTDGLVASRSVKRLLHGGCYGAILGALGGIVGLVLGEYVFRLAGGGVWPRAVGWAIFGAFVGTSDGFAQRMPAKVRYGILGGLLGGLVGGGTYEGIFAVLRSAGGRATALAWGSAIGLIILGACIGALVGLVESLLRKAWVKFMTGRLEGQTRTLDSSRPHTLGSGHQCTIILPGDPTVAPVHAEFFFQEEEVLVRPRDGDVVVRRDGRDQKISAPFSLQPGDRVHLGDTRMVFRKEEAKKS